MKTLNLFILGTLSMTLLFGCGSSAAILSTPIENIDNTPLKVSELTEKEKHTWGHLDLVNDTIPGMSVDKAYTDSIKTKNGKTVIVAGSDSGIYIEHAHIKVVEWR